MIRRLISLLIFAAIVYAGWNVGAVWFHYNQFKDTVREIALFGGGKADETLKGSVMDSATANRVPLDPDFIQITRRAEVGVGEHVTIKVAYAQIVQVLPGYQRRFDFDYTTP
jgi:hypothetical protein